MARPCCLPLFLSLACAIALPLMASESLPEKRVALVIDDGPVPEHNGPLLELLAREHVKVTFSHIGKNVQTHPEMSKRVAVAGHEIINHSFTHRHLKQLNDAEIEREVADTQSAIRQASEISPRWFWAPFLERDERVDAAVRRAGLEHFPYSKYHFIGSLDWEPQTTAEKFISLSTTGIVDGTVILMHEFPAVTLDNLGAVIAALKKQGVKFVTFSELSVGLPR